MTRRRRPLVQHFRTDRDDCMEPKPGAPYRACRACWRTCWRACCGWRNCAPPARGRRVCKIFAVERCGATTGACCCSFSSSDKARSMTLDCGPLFLVLGAQGCASAARKREVTRSLRRVFGQVAVEYSCGAFAVAVRRDANGTRNEPERPLRGTRRGRNNASSSTRAPESARAVTDRKVAFVFEF